MERDTHLDFLALVVNDIFYNGTNTILVGVVLALWYGGLYFARNKCEEDPAIWNMGAHHPHRHHLPRKFLVRCRTRAESLD